MRVVDAEPVVVARRIPPLEFLALTTDRQPPPS
jgi:hypothetical protein